MARRTRKPHGLRSQRCYKVDEAARAAGVCEATVRRWVRTGRVKPIDDSRPMLLAGADLLAVKGRKSHQKPRCAPGEAYCMRCRAIRPMAFREAEIASQNASGANLRALCGVCSTVMHKRVALADLAGLADLLTITATRADQDLIETAQPRVNVQSGQVAPCEPVATIPTTSGPVGRGG